MKGSAPLGGFYYQNCVAALKIIDCLFFKNDISSVVLENYDKGEHIDDIIIYRTSEREYYQIKWSDDEEKTYTLYSLLNSSDPKKKSIFKQLAEGYLTAKKESGTFSISLFTTKGASTAKRESEGVTLGLVDFIKDVILPVQSTSSRYDAILSYSNHKDLIEKVRTETGLNEDSFNDFLKTLKFNFDSDSIENIQAATKSKFTHLGIETNLYDTFINSVVKWSISGERITKDLLLDALGLQQRLEDKLSQFFKVVDDAYYVPNSDLYSKLDTALNELKGGYIFIEGLPGIGKSTALTKYRETNSDILFTYYCFIPDNTDFGKLRNKSEYFLKSMCNAVEQSFDEIDFPLRYSENYEQKLNEYLKKIAEVNRKAVFIVDGLDHVHRDLEFKSSSLLNYIKGDLPNNVYFILSSQYSKVLSDDVLQIVNTDSRRHIVVSEFNQTEIARYLKNKGIEADDLLDKIEQVSKGIPLYLHYISELLSSIPHYEYPAILDQLPNLLNGSINVYHEFLYQKIDNDPLAKWILALLAFRKEPIDFDTINAILDELGVVGDLVKIEKAVQTFTHLLRRHDNKYYSIFHNSFREFVIGKNQENKTKFNKALASFYEKNPHTDEAYRSYLKHLFEIGDYQKVIDTVTLDWVREAWNNYRSLDEISENVQVAWEAAAEVKSLSQFTKISFIKAQVGRLLNDIQNSEFGFPYLFLSAGLEQQSIRCIWNGDYVTTHKTYFASYLCRFYKKTGKLLPNRIIFQGYSKQSKDRNSDDITTILKGESLFHPNIKELFERIRSIEWTNHRDPNSDFLRKKKSTEENLRINQEIQLEIIQFLFEVKKFDALRTIEKEFIADPVISTASKLALAKLLLPNLKSDALTLLKQIDFASLSEPESSVAYISEYLSNEEVTEIIKYVPLLPEFQSEVVDKTHGYRIHKSFVDLLDKLKCAYVSNPDFISQAVLRATSSPSPAKNLYDFSIFLAEAWQQFRNSQGNKYKIQELLIKAMKSLNVPIAVIKARNDRSESIGESNFISRSIHTLYGQLFELACKALNTELLIGLVEQWFELETGVDGYSSYYCHLEIAKTIHQYNKTEFTEQKYKLIKEAERRARITEETASLIDELAEVAKAYGSCGFKEDFETIYKQLFDVAFGIGNRKDYQTELIILPLKALHKTDKENSLTRLQEIFEIQSELLGAGDGRMGHIALSNLIAFAIKDYPELAFKLIDFEENNIARQETLQIVLDDLFVDIKAEQLSYCWALVKTVSKWERSNYFFDLSISLLYEAIRLKNEKYTRIITHALKNHLIVENRDTEQLKKFLKIVNNEGLALGDDQLSLPDEKPYPNPANDKFKIWRKKWSIDDWVKMFDNDYNDFKIKIEGELVSAWMDSTNKKIRGEYHRSRYLFGRFYGQLGKEYQASIDKNERVIIREFLFFRDKMLAIGKTPSYSQVEAEFDVFLNSVRHVIPSETFDNFIVNEFDKEGWIDSFISLISGFTKSLLEEIMSETEIVEFCKKVSVLDYNNILDFISTRLHGETRSICKITVGERIISIAPDRVKEILIDLAKSENDRLILRSRDRQEPPAGSFLVKAMSKIDADFSKKILLDCYISQKGKYSFNVVADLNELFFYSEIFSDPGALRTYYDSNLIYNKGLAAGLPKKEIDYSFISAHKEKLSFEEVCIKYILSLFKYPVVKIRILAIHSIVDLVKEQPSSLKLIIKHGIKQNNICIIEYSLTALQAIALTTPNLFDPFKKDVWDLFKIPHFNINEQVKELLLVLNAHKSDFLSDEEKEFLNNVNQKSLIQISDGIINTLVGQKFIYSHYQSDLLWPLSKNDQGETLILNDVYYDLVINKGYNNYGGEQESAVHRRYNINSNFDEIEINSPYVDDTQDSINKVYYSKIKKDCFDEEFVVSNRYSFRLFDPSSFLYSKIRRPDYVNWIADGITEENFMSFTDLQTTISTFLKREEMYLTLYENGSQRPSEDYTQVELSTYFEIIAYAVKKGTPKEKQQSRLLPYVYSQNLYFHSMLSDIPNSSDFPENENVIPLIGVSYNKFRGEKNYSIAITLPDITRDLGFDCTNFHISLQEAQQNLQFLSWQNNYTSGRRRFLPSSEGVTLKINKEILLKYLEEKGLELKYKFKIRRSNTRFKPEDEMQWHSKSGDFSY